MDIWSFSRARELALLSRFASFTRELKKNSPINSSPIYYSKVSGLSKNSPDSKDNGKVWTAHLPEVSVLFFLAKRGAFCLLPRSLRSPDFERGGRPGARPAVAGLLEIDRSCV